MLLGLEMLLAGDFMPHGHCYLWKLDILLIHLVSDAVIALAYFSIPLALYLAAKRLRYFGMSRIAYLFAAFILLCGATHVMSIWTIWFPSYYAEGLVKIATAVVSALTAFAVWPLLPRVLSLPSGTPVVPSGEEIQKMAHTAPKSSFDSELGAFMTAVVSSSSDAVLCFSLSGTLLAANESALNMLELDKEEIEGARLPTFLDSACFSELDERMAQLREDDERELPPEVITVVNRDGESRFLSRSVSGVWNLSEDLVGISVFFRDITQQRLDRASLDTLGLQLRQKDEELEQFVYSVSHDLKSPLVTVQGFLGLMVDDLENENYEGVQDSAARLKSATEHMGALIEDLLKLSRVGKMVGDFEEVDPKEVVDKILSNLTHRINAKGATVEVQDNIPHVVCYKMGFRRALENLLTNALKYGCPEPGGRILVGGDTDGSNILIFVEDDGPGIDAAYREKIFLLFQRLTKSEKGTGMGLAIVKKIMHLHSGTCWVEESPGGGSRFILSFPAR